MKHLSDLSDARLREIAPRVPTSLRYLQNLAKGRRQPSVSMAIAIEHATRGQVPRESFEVACKGCKYLTACKKGTPK